MPDWNTLLDTPQKVRTAILCGLVALATLAAVIVYAVRAPGPGPEGDVPPPESGAASAAPQESASPEPSEAPEQSAGLVGLVPALTIDEARALALADAGVSEAEAEVSREALAEHNGIWVYEFRFHTEAARYEYTLNANSGEVRTMVKETADASGPAASTPPQSAPPAQTARPSQAPAATQPPASANPPAADVGIEGAKTAALKDAGVSAAQATFTKAEPGYEDGKMVYEIEFHTATHEYEYEILASTGGVYSRSAEAFQTTGAGTGSGGSTYIGMDRAKAAALEHAGLTAGQAAFTHASMDRDHGKMVYELEFRQGRTEYEYKIDAATGRILEHEMDVD